MGDYPHKLVGGDPVLDFLNSIHDWTAAEPRDHLTDFGAAVGFGEAAGLLTRAEARRLAGSGRTELDGLRELRTLLERVFRAEASGAAPAAADLERLARLSAESTRLAGLRRRGPGDYARVVSAAAAGAAVLRWRLVDCAVSLLTSPRLARLKACPRCGWFFLDTSRNRSRRWCSMADCGNVTKVRRYYRRQQAAKGRAERG